MNPVDQKLKAAADETKRFAATRRAPSLSVQRAHSRGWMAFAAAFAVVVLAFGLGPWLVGVGDPPPVGGSAPSTQPSTPPTSVAETTLASAPDACPEAPVPSPIEELPAAVAETRDAIIAAATACDFATLQALAGDRFTTSYGGGGPENLAIWNDKGLEPTATLLNLLDMRHTTIQGDTVIYVWPAAFGYETWDQVTEEDLDELARIHTEGEFDLFAAGGAYLGWRTGIDENGNWLYFVAGD